MYRYVRTEPQVSLWYLRYRVTKSGDRAAKCRGPQVQFVILRAASPFYNKEGRKSILQHRGPQVHFIT